MKKIILLFIVLLTSVLFAQYTAPYNLDAVSNIDSEVPVSWFSAPPMPDDYIEFGYEDESSLYGMDINGHGSSVFMKFSVDEPCSLIGTKFRVYPLFGLDPTHEYDLRVRIFDDVAGRPDVLGDPIYEHRTFASDFGWLTVIFDSTVHLSEDYHIGVYRADTASLDFCYILGDTIVSETPSRGQTFDGAFFEYFNGDFAIHALYPVERTLEYEVQYANNPYTGWYGLVTTTDTVYNHTGLDNGTPYYYRVRAIHDDIHESEWTDIAYAMPRGYVANRVILDTLQTESGTPSGSASIVPTNRLAVKHKPPCAAMLYGIMYHFDIPGNYLPAIYDVEDGEPGEEIFSWPSILTATEGWNSPSGLSALNLMFDDEFVVSCNVNSRSLALSFAYPEIPDRTYDYYSATEEWHPVADTAYFIRAIMKYETGKYYANIRAGWNMVSIPIIPEERAASDIFPTMISGMCYKYDSEEGRYVLLGDDEELEPGIGYFVLSETDTSYIVTGTPVESFDFQVNRAWNLIGSTCSYPGHHIIDDAGFLPDESIRNLPYVYEYNPETRNYDATTYIAPGKAYWVNCADEGIIRFVTD